MNSKCIYCAKQLNDKHVSACKLYVSDQRYNVVVGVDCDMSEEEGRAVDYLNGLCPDASTRLWLGNCIHGEQFLVRGRNVMMADISTAFLKLWAVGVLRPTKFTPSHSGAAFLGLDTSQRGTHDKPNASDAAHWTWEVVEGVA